MLLALSGGAILSYRITGSTLPSNPKDAMIFQNGVLLIVLGSALIEYKFTKPADSVVNSLAGMMTLFGVYYLAPSLAWWVVFLYCASVFVIGTLCVAVSSGPDLAPWQQRVAFATYRPAVFFGRARLLYSVLFLFALFAFRSIQSQGTIELVIFWGLFVVLWPLGVPEFLALWRSRQRKRALAIGRVVQTDWANIVRVALNDGAIWSPAHLKLLRQSDGKQILVVPLYTQPQEEVVIGTGICIGPCAQEYPGLNAGNIYDAPEEEQLSQENLARALGADVASKLIGFVVEDSEIAQLRVETWDVDACHEGMLVFVVVGGNRIYYQVTNGTTREEALQSNRHGYQVATVAQVGKHTYDRGFTKYSWLPPMNAPVFSLPSGASAESPATDPGDFVYGMMPETVIPVVGALVDAIDHHIALLGVTGSGKTELAFELIRHAAAQGVKIICVDLTARYAKRLSDLSPVMLSLSAQTSAELGAKLFDAETGSYGAGQEKKVLKTFTDKLRTEVGKSVKDFLDSDGVDNRIGLITLEEIANTKATLTITELYLSTILRYAKERSRAANRILVVLEEAHTVVPEPSSMGLGDHDSRGVVGKIAQIALQGRKYGVGLLVVAQRTATVSKSILTQCNTVISFTCIDDTSLGFLSNVFGRAHTELIPNLPPLHAVVYGKGVRSERPLIVQIPFSSEKKRLADMADGRIAVGPDAPAPPPPGALDST